MRHAASSCPTCEVTGPAVGLAWVGWGRAADWHLWSSSPWTTQLRMWSHRRVPFQGRQGDPKHGDQVPWPAALQRRGFSLPCCLLQSLVLSPGPELLCAHQHLPPSTAPALSWLHRMLTQQPGQSSCEIPPEARADGEMCAQSSQPSPALSWSPGMAALASGTAAQPWPLPQEPGKILQGGFCISVAPWAAGAQAPPPGGQSPVICPRAVLCLLEIILKLLLLKWRFLCRNMKWYQALLASVCKRFLLSVPLSIHRVERRAGESLTWPQSSVGEHGSRGRLVPCAEGSSPTPAHPQTRRRPSPGLHRA